MSIQIVRQSLASVLGKPFCKDSAPVALYTQRNRVELGWDTCGSCPKLFLIGTIEFPKVANQSVIAQIFADFFASKNIDAQTLINLGATLEVFYEKANNPNYKCEWAYVYATVDVLAVLAQQAEEVAQIQEAAELEAAELENETETVALPENAQFVGLEFIKTDDAENMQFCTNRGTYPYLHGKYAYKWGSYTYCTSDERVYAQDIEICEGAESVQDAYEICAEHFANWEWETIYKTPTRTETLAKEIFNDTLAQNPLIQQDFGQSSCTQIIDVCADSTFAGLGISAQSACALPQPQAETAPAETVGNPETPQTDPYLAERPIDETITAKEFYSYPAPETLTDEQIDSLFEYSTSIAEDTGFWDISIGKTLYQLVSYHNSGEYGLYKRREGIAEWNVLILTHAQIIREAYTLIYKDLCQISPFAPRETIINLEADKGLSDMQVREVEKSLLIGINTAENFIIYNARAEYDTKAARWLCVGKDHKTGKRLEGYINACKIIQPYKQTL